MTERELRENVRKQILQNFHENKDSFIKRKDTTISLSELRTIVRSELIKRLNEEKEESSKDEEEAAEELDGLDAAMQNLIKTGMQNIQNSSKKKDEALGTVISLAVAAPGFLSLMSGAAKLIAKGFNKITKSKKFDPEQEGKTFEHAAHHLHEKYIKWLKPVVKMVFKKQIAGDEKKAEIYAQVVYAVILAAVATHALGGAASGVMESIKGLGDIAHTAYEAAHGMHVTMEVNQMAAGVRAALAAIGEKEAARELATAAASMA